MKATTKQQFLTHLKEITSLNSQSDFIDYFAELISGNKGFKHSYEIKFKKWKKAVNSDNWSCQNLLEAKNNYWWHGGFDDNKKTLNQLSGDLQTSILNKKECDTLYCSMRILEWGDVYKGCTGYILDKYQNGLLGSSIIKAVEILEDENDNTNFFDQKELRMDSGLTKIYSLAGTKSIILDSRVVAALSLLAIRFFGDKDLKTVAKLKAFACGTSNSSEKKRSQIKGVKIFSPYLQPDNQAHYNLVSNWMLDATIIKAKEKNKELFKMWNVKDDVELLRAIEASLFMIGSDISNG